MGNNKFNGLRGAEGQFYVAALLAAHNVHATVTVGNASNVDLLASSETGSNAIAIQVKSKSACSKNKKVGSKKERGKYWVVGKHPQIVSDAFWYAFVDLHDGGLKENKPLDVYFVPSRWVVAFCSGIAKMPYFFLKESIAVKMRNNTTDLVDYINGKKPPLPIPDDMLWLGTNQGLTTKQMLKRF